MKKEELAYRLGVYYWLVHAERAEAHSPCYLLEKHKRCMEDPVEIIHKQLHKLVRPLLAKWVRLYMEPEWDFADED